MYSSSSEIRCSRSGRNAKPLDFTLDSFRGHKNALVDNAALRHYLYNLGISMDAIQAPTLTPSITTPIQFLQAIQPGLVYTLTAPLQMDEVIGYSVAGNWEDEEVVQQTMELLGKPTVYGDYANTPFSSWQSGFERQTIVRFEEGMEIDPLEQKRASRINIDSAGQKRQAAAEALEIVRNDVAVYGYNGGANRTYGFLNAPGLPAYITAANGVSGSPLWAYKTLLEIEADIQQMANGLIVSSKGLVNPGTMATTLVLGTADIGFLGTAAQFNVSVQDWITKTYPKMRVVCLPQLDGANGGANVAYLFADKVSGRSTDNGKTFDQLVPIKFQLLGVQQLAKGYQEAYSNATAGTWCKRPFAVSRITGI